MFRLLSSFNIQLFYLKHLPRIAIPAGRARNAELHEIQELAVKSHSYKSLGVIAMLSVLGGAWVGIDTIISTRAEILRE